MLLFSMISVMSSSLLSPRISSIGVLPTPRSSGRSLAVTPTNSDDSNIDAVEPALATRRAILGGAAATGSLILGGAPERAAAVGWDFDTSSEPLPANRRITSKVGCLKELALRKLASFYQGILAQSFSLCTCLCDIVAACRYSEHSKLNPLTAFLSSH